MSKGKLVLEGLSDSEIWNLFRSGEDSALDFIYEKYFNKLYNYGCQFTKDRSLVEDTLQDLFIDLKRRCAHLSPTDKILPYLYSAFRRKIIRARTKLTNFVEHDLESSSFAVPAVDVSLIQLEEQIQNNLRLQRAMKDLPENYREIIYLFYYENLGYEEIREIQGFENVKSARNLLYKALSALRSRIGMFLLLFFLGFIFPGKGRIG